MKRLIPLLIFLLALASCTEEFDTGKESISDRYFVVEAILTDLPGTQTILLSNSIPYTGEDEDRPVSGASVSVSDGERDYAFTEDPDTPGSYCSDLTFRAQSGRTYTLTITSGGHTYTATSEMQTFGFDIDRLDYKYTPSVAENTWTIGAWGQNSSGNYYLISCAINGEVFPLEYSTLLDDKYFGEARLEGFPVVVLSQGESKQKALGDLGKPLQTGDIVSLICQNLDRSTYEYMNAFSNNVSSVSIPILSAKPDNLPTNIKGDCALGYFAVCPTRVASCLVDDPFRTDFISIDAYK